MITNVLPHFYESQCMYRLYRLTRWVFRSRGCFGHFWVHRDHTSGEIELHVCLRVCLCA